MSELREQVDKAVAEGRLAEALWDINRAAELLRRTPGPFYQWRSYRTGPRSYKVGNSIMYDPADLRAYLLSHVQEPAA